MLYHHLMLLILTVTGQPTQPVITSPTVTLGDSFNLTCSSESTRKASCNGPTFNYTWVKNGQKTDETGPSLLIENLPLSAFNSSYTCTVQEYSGPRSNSSVPFYLIFQYIDKDSMKLVINGNSTYLQAFAVNDTITVECTIDAYPLARYMSLTGRSTEYNTNFIRLVKNITCEDNRRLRCYRSHPIRSVSVTMNVNVICPPQMIASITPPLIFYSDTKDRTVFSIQIVGYPKPTYSVMEVTSNGLMSLPITYEIQPQKLGFILQIYNVTEDVTGVYQVTASNMNGILVQDFTIKINPRSRPTNLIAWSTTSDTVSLTWMDDRNYAEFEQIVYKEEGKAWKTIYGPYMYLDPYIIGSLKPNTRYFFMAQDYLRCRDSLYSNLAEARTIREGDNPQPRPTSGYVLTTATTNKPRTSSEPSDSTSTSEAYITTPQLISSDLHTSTAKPANVASQQTKSPSFLTGIGIGLSVGFAVAVLTVIITVIILRRSGLDKKTSVDVTEHEYATASPVAVTESTFKDLQQDNLYDSLDRNQIRAKSGYYENVQPTVYENLEQTQTDVV